MIKEEYINGLLFQEQRTYRVYRSKESLMKGEGAVLITSDEEVFNANRKLAAEKLEKGEDNKFIVM